MHCCRIVNGIKKQKHKKTALEQCGMLRIWRCDCALCVIGNEFPCRPPHSPSTTLLRSPHCTKDKNRSPFHGEKPLVIKRILGRRSYQIFQTILHGRDAILRVRDKLLISNMILQLWADVKYHVPTGFGFSPKASGFYPFDDATALAGESGVGDVAWLIQASA